MPAVREAFSILPSILNSRPITWYISLFQSPTSAAEILPRHCVRSSPMIATALEHGTVIFSQKPKVASKPAISALVWSLTGMAISSFRSASASRGGFVARHKILVPISARWCGSSRTVKFRLNPFVSKAGARPEIWTYGHRNVQAAAINPASGELWTIEHGPRGGDEINIDRPGLNFGWPLVSFGVNYDGTPVNKGEQTMEGVTPPIYRWTGHRPVRHDFLRRRCLPQLEGQHLCRRIGRGGPGSLGA